MRLTQSSRQYLLWTAALVAAVFICIGLTLPPRARDLNDVVENVSTAGSVVRGAFHVHTNQSDGGGTLDEVSAAAALAGLDFVILTDHGDGTRGAKASYRDGVLMVEGVEISSDGGHYIAVGMQPTPYRLGGDARGVVEDVRRFGGFGVVAHPTSLREELRWTNWGLAVDGVEWLNGDSQWRDDGIVALFGVGIRYWFRPVESLALLLRRPVAALARWDVTLRDRVTVGLGGSDAHARLATGVEDDGYADGMEVRFPWYETLFRTYGLRVELDRIFSGDAIDDASQLITQLKAGRVFTAVDAVASPVQFLFSGVSGDGHHVRMGGSIPADKGLVLTATIGAPDDGTLRLFQNGNPILETVGRELVYGVEAESPPAVYRIEVNLEGGIGEPAIPWIVSNPIYTSGVAPEPVSESSLVGGRLFDAGRWNSEHSRDAQIRIGHDDDGFELFYRLGPDTSTYTAAVYDVTQGQVTSNAGVEFTGSATQPMRVSLQLRQGGDADNRWRHSFYLERTPRRIQLRFSEFAPVSSEVPKELSIENIDGILFVVDTVNLNPNTAGMVRIDRFEIGRVQPN